MVEEVLPMAAHQTLPRTLVEVLHRARPELEAVALPEVVPLPVAPLLEVLVLEVLPVRSGPEVPVPDLLPAVLLVPGPVASVGEERVGPEAPWEQGLLVSRPQQPCVLSSSLGSCVPCTLGLGRVWLHP